MSAGRNLLRGGGRFLGSALAAIACAALLTTYGAWHGQGSLSSGPFLVALGVAIASWLLLRRRHSSTVEPVLSKIVFKYG